MIAAIYSRKSTEQIGANNDEKSVTRQIEHAKLFATKRGNYAALLPETPRCAQFTQRWLLR